MRLGLNPRSEHGEHFGIGAGERVCRHGGRTGGAYLGDRLGVGDAADRTGLAVISDDHALVPGASGALGIGEHADQLGAEGRQRSQLARHDPPHTAVADRPDLPKRLRPFAVRQRDHRAAHGGNAAGIVEELLDPRRVIESYGHGAALYYETA